MEKKKKSPLKIILIILLILLILAGLVAGGAVIYWNKVLQPKIAEQLTPENLPEGELPKGIGEILLEEVEQILQEPDVQEYINQENPNETSELLGEIEAAKQKNQQIQPTPTPQATNAPKEEKEDVSGVVPKAYRSLYEQHKNEIDPNDLRTAIRLASKVDVGYLLGFLKGGLTSAEKKEMKAYLMQRMSSSDISKGVRLFSKYSYLLSYI